MSSTLFNSVFSGRSSSESENEDKNNFNNFVPIDVDKITPRRNKFFVNLTDEVIHLDDLDEDFINLKEDGKEKDDGDCSASKKGKK